MKMADNPIPLLDFSDPSITPAERAKQVGNAVATVGFLHVKGAGISQEQIREMFEIVSVPLLLPIN